MAKKNRDAPISKYGHEIVYERTQNPGRMPWGARAEQAYKTGVTNLVSGAYGGIGIVVTGIAIAAAIIAYKHDLFDRLATDAPTNAAPTVQSAPLSAYGAQERDNMTALIRQANQREATPKPTR